MVSITGKDLKKLFQKQGYKEVKGTGKGSHIKLKKGSKTIIISGEKELTKGLESVLKKQLYETCLIE